MRKDVPDLLLNRATCTITATTYDRRALDTLAVLPLTHTCISLAALVRTTPSVRARMLADGGLEMLVAILHRTQPTDTRRKLLWIAAFKALVEFAVHGAHDQRLAVAKLGVLPLALRIVASFAASATAHAHKIVADAAAAHARRAGAAGGADPAAVAPRQQLLSVAAAPSAAAAAHGAPVARPVADAAASPASPAPAPGPRVPPRAPAPTTTTRPAPSPLAAVNPAAAAATSPLPSFTNGDAPTVTIIRPDDPMDVVPVTIVDPSRAAVLASATAPPAPHSRTTPLEIEQHQDIRLTLQLLSALVPYPAVRAYLRRPVALSAAKPAGGAPQQQPSGFALVQSLVAHPVAPIRELATAIMVQSLGSVVAEAASPAAGAHPQLSDTPAPGTLHRACANLACARTESSVRPFARCTGCRAAFYCSRECQVAAWNHGHRYWCGAAAAAVAAGTLVVGGPGAAATAAAVAKPRAPAVASSPYARPATARGPVSAAADAGTARVERMRAAAAAHAHHHHLHHYHNAHGAPQSADVAP
ncbi:hypothetical protein H9P43_008102 [Blastocladiella emersonii ATCC 22665]|nr:hypothetical protein H9P43_008102 [Blastocladiella emersonii ATCC 22665]